MLQISCIFATKIMAGKKHQIVIPETSTLSFTGMSKKELGEWCRAYYKSHFIGEKVVNLDMGIEISFKRLGNKKTSYGAAMYPKKAAAILVLDEMLKYAIHTNWGERKPEDPGNVIAYCNFKCKLLVDNDLCFFAINVQICNDGKFHYSIDECRFKYKTSRNNPAR